MSVESYIYDEPVGIYGHESHERLARGVLNDMTLYEEALKIPDVFSELPDLGVTRVPSEEFRISSIVESRTARRGYALALAKHEDDRTTMGGVLYHVDREDLGLFEDKAFVITRPETFQSNQDYRDQVEGLMHSFDKSELELIMRMLGKMTTSIELSREMHGFNDDDLAALSVAGRMKQEAKIKRTKDILKRVAGIEPFVLGALHNHHRQQELRAFLPSGHHFSEKQENLGGNEHILDWEEFVEAARNLLNNSSDPSSAVAHVNVHYEIDSKLYYIKLVSEQGQLSGVQVLCDDTGAWQSQIFELDTPHEDQADLNIISPIWDKPDILSSLQNGETIDNESYEYYRKLAEKSIQDSFSKPENLIPVPSTA